jgi:hypothetical protein
MRHIVVLAASLLQTAPWDESDLVDVAGVIGNLELVYCAELSLRPGFQPGSLVAS